MTPTFLLLLLLLNEIRSGAQCNRNMSPCKYRNSYCRDKTNLRTSCLQNGITYTDWTASLYWSKALTLMTNTITEVCTGKLELCSVFVFAQSPWRGTNVLDYWQLTMLPQSERCEIDSHTRHENFSVPLWFIAFPRARAPTINTTNMLLTTPIYETFLWNEASSFIDSNNIYFSIVFTVRE